MRRMPRLAASALTLFIIFTPMALQAQVRPARPDVSPVVPRLAGELHDSVSHGSLQEDTEGAGAFERLLARTFVGAAGWGVGALVGGYAGHQTLRRNEFDDGFGGMILGAAVGGAIGAAAGAAIPAMGDGCSGGGRFVTSLLGSAAGFGVSGVIASESGALAVPIITTLGAVIGSLACRAR